jgi:hypothetical protein
VIASQNQGASDGRFHGGPAKPPQAGYPGGPSQPGGGWIDTPMPGRKPPQTGNGAYGGQSTQAAPKYISADSTQSAINNRMGQAHMMGDQRMFQKQAARNGLGSSRGTGYLSQIGQQQALSQGRADSAGIAAQDQMNNAKARLDFQFGREREAQALAMVQHAMSQAGWGQQFAGAQAAESIRRALMNQQMGMLQGLFN